MEVYPHTKQDELGNTNIMLGKKIIFNMEETQAPLESFFFFLGLKKRMYVKQPAKNIIVVVSFSLSYTHSIICLSNSKIL